ncbi:type II secretion system GspH family protein [Candidatus Microgenomates bacterium]|nr:type II secretion system GspH family protein [Candidatus Microgenomates bacterium]
MDNSFLKKAFTLIELLIVMTIIVALALIALVGFRSQIFKGKDAKRKADLKRIQIAVEEYEKDHDCYPLASLVTCNPGNTLLPYVDRIPCDPVTNKSYFYEHEDSVCPKWYRFYTRLDNGADSDIEKLKCTSGCGPNSAYNYYATSPNVSGEIGSSGGSSNPSGGNGGGGGGQGDDDNFYGCHNGSCVPINWNNSIAGPECSPNYQNPTCYDQCTSGGSPVHECM